MATSIATAPKIICHGFAPLLEIIINEIEREHCTCGAELDRHKPATWEHCGIHRRIRELRVQLNLPYGN